MSQAKDRSLTIMVSGKPSAVVQARREILTKLQTQVSLLVPETCTSYTTSMSIVHAYCIYLSIKLSVMTRMPSKAYLLLIPSLILTPPPNNANLEM